MPAAVDEDLEIDRLLRKQVLRLLHELDGDDPIEFKARLAAYTMIVRWQVSRVVLRKEKRDKPDAGSTVRKYADHFKQAPAAASSGKARSRPHAVPEPEPDIDIDALLSDTDDDAAA